MSHYNTAVVADIDIEALMMIARLEATFIWPDDEAVQPPPPGLPAGFDLHHWADFEWIEQEVAKSETVD